VVGQQPRPGIDRARHGDRVGRGALDFRDALALVPLHSGLGRRPARTVESNNTVAAAGGHQYEAIAANPGGLGLDHALNRAGRHCGIQGVAAVPQNVDCR
jgi:hypothetical protein